MGYFRRIVDYLSGSPPAPPKEPDISHNSPRGTQPRKPPKYSPFAPQIQKYISFCPVEVSQIPEETPDHSKEFLIFAPFQPFLPSFGVISVFRSCRSCADAVSLLGPRGRKERQPLCPCCRWSSGPQVPRPPGNRGRTTQQNEEHNRTRRPDGAGVPPVCRSAPDAVSLSETEAHKERGKRNERKGRQRSGATTSPQAHKKRVPPPIAMGRQPFPSSQIRAKKSAKSRLG